MDSYELEVKFQVVLLVVEAAAYLALAAWCANRRGDGGWATAGAVGSGVVGAVLGLSAVSLVAEAFFSSSWLIEKIYFHEHAQTLFAVARVAGVLLLVGAVVVSRRTPPARTSSIYGPDTP